MQNLTNSVYPRGRSPRNGHTGTKRVEMSYKVVLAALVAAVQLKQTPSNSLIIAQVTHQVISAIINQERDRILPI